MRRTIIGALAALCLLVFPNPGETASIKKALRLLWSLQAVDGSGSGLDADMVDGLSPAQIASGTVGALLAASYERIDSVIVSPGFCGCVLAECADADDAIIDCDGAVDPYNAGTLSEAMTYVSVQPRLCSACGCATGATVTVFARAGCIALVTAAETPVGEVAPITVQALPMDEP